MSAILSLWFEAHLMNCSEHVHAALIIKRFFAHTCMFLALRFVFNVQCH